MEYIRRIQLQSLLEATLPTNIYEFNALLAKFISDAIQLGAEVAFQTHPQVALESWPIVRQWLQRFAPHNPAIRKLSSMAEVIVTDEAKMLTLQQEVEDVRRREHIPDPLEYSLQRYANEEDFETDLLAQMTDQQRSRFQQAKQHVAQQAKHLDDLRRHRKRAIADFLQVGSQFTYQATRTAPTEGEFREVPEYDERRAEYEREKEAWGRRKADWEHDPYQLRATPRPFPEPEPEDTARDWSEVQNRLLQRDEKRRAQDRGKKLLPIIRHHWLKGV